MSDYLVVYSGYDYAKGVTVTGQAIVNANWIDADTIDTMRTKMKERIQQAELQCDLRESITILNIIKLPL